MKLIQTFTSMAYLCALSSITWAGSVNTDADSLRHKVIRQFDKAPLLFEENHGQAAKDITFVSHAPGYRVYVAPSKVDFYLGGAKSADTNAKTADTNNVPVQPVSIGFEAADPAAHGVALEETPTRSSYLIGGKSRWIENLVNYKKVHYDNVWPGIGITYYGTGYNLEYDFELQPGADSSRIQCQFSGVQALRLDSDGNLILTTADSDIVQHRPRIYQTGDKGIVEIAGGYRILADQRVGFDIAPYDHAKPLVIDPVVSFNTTAMGFAVAAANAVTEDSQSNTYLTGRTFSSPPSLPQVEAFLTKLGPTGNIISSVEFGGTDGATIGNAIAIDTNGAVYIAGQSAATDLIKCNCGFQAGLANPVGTYDGFLIVFPATSLTGPASYITYIGGVNNDAINAVTADASGAAYVSGITFSANFPTTEGAPNAALNGTAFAAKIDTTKLSGPSSKVWVTFVGGTGTGGDAGTGIAIDGSLNVYVAGSTTSSAASFSPYTTTGYITTKSTTTNDGFVIKLNPAGNSPTWFSFFPLGPINGLSLFNSRFAYLAGQTTGNINTTASAFQTSGGANHAFFADLDTTLTGASALVYSTYLRGSGLDFGASVAAAPNGRGFIAGWTTSPDFPVVGTPVIQGTFNGSREGFLAFIDPSQTGAASLPYSMFIGTANTVVTGVASDTFSNAAVSAATFDNAAPPHLTGGLSVRLGGQIFDPTFFVSQLYLDLLDRGPEPGGLSFWVGLLNSGAETRSQVAGSFFNSQEFSQAGLTIIKYYIAVLGRNPDFGGWKFWFDQYNNNHTTLTSILTSFLNMPEFQNTYGTLTNDQFVNLVYQNVLGRAPDQAGHDFWVGKLNAQQVTRADMMGTFINGGEFSTNIRARAFANLLYMGFLRRSAEPGGLLFWTGILADPNQLPSSIGTFISSPEYIARFN